MKQTSRNIKGLKKIYTCEVCGLSTTNPKKHQCIVCTKCKQIIANDEKDHDCNSEGEDYE